jgi:hypothetical protein
MSPILTMTISMVPSLLSILMARMGLDNQDRKPVLSSRPPPALPPEVLSNLPQVDMVDIRAMFKKWED